jgi:hypothetical protein
MEKVAGTHILGQNFLKLDVKFANAEGNKNMFGGSWGVSTRLMVLCNDAFR